MVLAPSTVPRRYLYVLLAFVLILIALLSHPTSRAWANQAKDSTATAVSNLTKGAQESWTSWRAGHHDAPPPLPSPLPEDEKLDPPTASDPVEAISTAVSTPTIEQPATSTKEEVSKYTQDDTWTGATWFFEGDNELYPNPKFDVPAFKQYAPHNYEGPGHETVAIFLATRNGSMQDSYFLAAQQQVYRILWDPRTKSKHPLTAFVAPFVKQEQRDYLAAAGALVKELPLLSWTPLYSLNSSPRWKDQFTKLNLWDQGEYSKILYLDTDAFPIRPFDELLSTVSEPHLCREDILPDEDKIDVAEMCHFTFTATRDARGMLNAGMFVLEPNKAMHEYLLRGMLRDREHFDNNIVEQGYLQYVFRPDGPFPGQYVDRKWNRIESQADEENDTIILHEKLWIFYFMPDHWARYYFNDTWMDMKKLYESNEFLELRKADGMAKLPS